MTGVIHSDSGATARIIDEAAFCLLRQLNKELWPFSDAYNRLVLHSTGPLDHRCGSAYNSLTYIGIALLLRVCVNLVAHRGYE